VTQVVMSDGVPKSSRAGDVLTCLGCLETFGVSSAERYERFQLEGSAPVPEHVLWKSTMC
jgi:hypothetical protein